MNSLSWFMYWAGVVGSFNMFIGIIFIFACFVFPIAAVLIGINDDYRDDIQTARLWEKYRQALFASLIIFALSNFIPSQKTLYMIAASEMGEEVLKTDEANKLRIILNDKLDEMLHEGDNQE